MVNPTASPAAASAEVDYIVAGQGLAGTVMALTLLRAGRRVLVAAGERAASSSRAALGIVCPVTGMRFTPSYRFAEAIGVGRPFYEHWEQVWDTRLWHPAPIHRFLNNAAEKARWFQNREKVGPIATTFTEAQPWNRWAAYLRPPGKYWITLQGGGWLDIPRLLDLARAELARRGSLVSAKFDPCDARVEDGGGVEWNGTRAGGGVILCEGYPGLAGNPLLEGLPRRSAKGEVLLIRADLPATEIIQSGIFLVPTAEPGLWRAGANYEWADLTDTPTAAGRAALEATLRRHFAFDWEVVDHFAGVRPILTDKLPILGRLAGRPGYTVLNGLASKGALMASWAAATLLRHLENDEIASIPPELDVRRNFPL